MKNKIIEIPISITKTKRLKDKIKLTKPILEGDKQEKQAAILARYLNDNATAFFMEKFIEKINET